MDTRGPGCEQTRIVYQANFIPAFSRNRPIMSGKFMQGRSGRSGSFGNSMLYGRPLPRRRMNRSPQAFSTLLHCPDGSQHHFPPYQRTKSRRRVHQPQVQLLIQCGPQASLHLTADSDSTLPTCMLTQPLAVPMSTRAHNTTRAWS
jgi:hypothetical protein